MRSRNSLWSICIILLLSAPQGAITSDVEVVKQFSLRVGEYVKLHRDVESKLPALPKKASPEQITAHQQALAQVIRAARPRAQRGDIFSTAEEYFRCLIAAEVKGKDGVTARETIKDGNPQNEPTGEPLIISVNAAYPPKAPVSTVPPTMLLRLPPLPDELNYRFVGRHLILHDTHADLIVMNNEAIAGFPVPGRGRAGPFVTRRNRSRWKGEKAAPTEAIGVIAAGGREGKMEILD